MSENPFVRDIMSSPVETTRRDASVSAVAETMRTKEVSALLITTSPLSIITTTDILDAVAENRDTSELTVDDLMTESVETVPPTLRAGEAAAMMTSLGVNYLPVVDGGDYVGIVSSADLTEQVA
jgi:CBS domain-containing protein